MTWHANPGEVGWHPAPNGIAELWYWDGRQWCDPIEQVQEQVTELVIPHLERVYLQGFAAGYDQGSSKGTTTAFKSYAGELF